MSPAGRLVNSRILLFILLPQLFFFAVFLFSICFFRGEQPSELFEFPPSPFFLRLVLTFSPFPLFLHSKRMSVFFFIPFFALENPFPQVPPCLFFSNPPAGCLFLSIVTLFFSFLDLFRLVKMCPISTPFCLYFLSCR